MADKNTDAFMGREAPSFCLPDAEEKEVCLEGFRGKWVVLYFYPKDNTQGCTLEAISFTAQLEKFSELGAQVIGISPDSPESHQRFIDKHNLGVLLLSDAGHRVLSSYDVWKTKKMYGREFFGVERSTFLIDPAGKIADVWRKVSVKGHAESVRETLLRKSGK